MRLWVLSLKTEKLSYLRGKENKRIRQQNERIDQRKKQIKLHLSPPNQTSYRQLRLIYSTVAKGASQQAWGRFNRSLIKNQNALQSGERWYNPVCRRRESNPHSRREHDFESCASAYSATSANAFASIPLSSRRSSEIFVGQDDILPDLRRITNPLHAIKRII